MAFEEFDAQLQELFYRNRSQQDIEDYRLGKSPWKSLRDEIVPVHTFITSQSTLAPSHLRFPLDNQTPDCWVKVVGGEWRGIEVTIERGHERYHLAKELNEEGLGRGFIGIQDDEPQSEFDSRMNKPRIMYSTSEALSAAQQGIGRCLQKKNDQRYADIHYLVIESDLCSLPKDRWSAILAGLNQDAVTLPFQEIYVVPTRDCRSGVLQLKPQP